MYEMIVYGAKAEDLDILRINATASHEKVTGGYSTNQGACQHIFKCGTCMRLRKAKINWS
jgi:hypothetical protein